MALGMLTRPGSKGTEIHGLPFGKRERDVSGIMRGVASRWKSNR